ncbi:NADPH:quinone reductase-like Zn-dependent oxidoreductase [Xanthomonas arboricola]
MRELGADVFIDYTRVTPEDAISEADLVVDAVGGPATGRFLQTLKRGGALFPIFPLGFDGRQAAGTLGVSVSTTQVRSSGAQLAALAPLLQSGVVRVAIDSSFDLSQARQAHERAAQGHIQGKIVMTVE